MFVAKGTYLAPKGSAAGEFGMANFRQIATKSGGAAEGVWKSRWGVRCSFRASYQPLAACCAVHFC
ncbi:MAG: hypothetical protein Aurels2KO_32090 [Aureliella sp.]